MMIDYACNDVMNDQVIIFQAQYKHTLTLVVVYPLHTAECITITPLGRTCHT